jgi:Ras-related protein Rab-4B
VKLNIWDTAGQEKYRTVTRMYYNNSDAILLVYDATFRETFDQLSFWIGDISKNLLGGNDIGTGNFIVALVGNKTDKAEDIQVSLEDAHEFAKTNHIDIVMEVSAKKNIGIAELFDKVS